MEMLTLVFLCITLGAFALLGLFSALSMYFVAHDLWKWFVDAP